MYLKTQKLKKSLFYSFGRSLSNRQETGADGVVVGPHIGLKLKVMHTPQPLGDNQRKPSSNRRSFGGICPDFS
jgi:hypothetical protein